MEEYKTPTVQIIFGDIIYWLCVLAAIMCIVGPVISILFVDNNVLNPHYLYSAIWEGKSSDVVWQEIGGGFPGGHFWMQNLTTGDGFTQFGMVIGCACALPALVAAAIAYSFHKPRPYLWIILSLWVAFIIAYAMGLLQF